MLVRSILVASFWLCAAGVFSADGVAPPRPLTLAHARALVFSPHPDDATLGAAGLIQRVFHSGGTVRVVEMTAGDAFPQGVKRLRPDIHAGPLDYRWYGSVREREAIHALRQLGVGRSSVRMLGFPDEGLCHIASADFGGAPFESPYTKRTAPPEDQQILQGATYRPDDLVRELAQIITEFRPTLIVVPDPLDQHPDHCATHLLMHHALDRAIRAGLRSPTVLHYIVHYPRWPAVVSTAAPMEPLSNTHTEGWRWTSLQLTTSERAAKHRALEAYRSQMLVMADFIGLFERSNELFVEGEPTAVVPCWCDAANIASAISGR